VLLLMLLVQEIYQADDEIMNLLDIIKNRRSV